MTVYRLSSRRYPGNDGLGASLYGGRWNQKGTPVVYAAASRALCALKVLANAGELAGDYVVIPIEISGELAITTVSLEVLEPDWNRGEPARQTRDIGSEWARNLRSAVLVVPSAVVPQEQNYILNPRHPDFPKIRFYSPEPFYFDDRLRRRLA